MLYSSLMIGLATIGLTAAESEIVSRAVAPPKNQEFHVAFTISVNGDQQDLYVSLVQNGTLPAGTISNLLLTGDHTRPATPAYFNSTSTGTALDFDLTTSRKDPTALYGAQLYNLGTQHGHAVPVRGLKGRQDTGWISSQTGYISHKLLGKGQSLYACTQEVNGVLTYVLNTGVSQTNGQPPTGCQTTLVKQIFDIPGGAKPSP